MSRPRATCRARAAELADAYSGLNEASHDTERTAPIDVADAGRLYWELWSNFPRFAGKIASRGERESKSGPGGGRGGPFFRGIAVPVADRPRVFLRHPKTGALVTAAAATALAVG